MSRRTVTGEDATGVYLWEATEISDTEWLSAGKGFNTLVRHPSLAAVVQFWLASSCGPDTYSVFTSWGTVSHPAKVIPNRISDLVTAELKGSQ